MSRITWGIIVAPVLAFMLVIICRTEASADAHTSIVTLESKFTDAVKAKDLDKIMDCYANSDDLVIFDVIPPLQYTGWNAYKEDWRNFLAQCKDAPTLEISNLEIDGDTRVAYSHSIQHFTCTNQQGNKLDLTFRVTDGYHNFHHQWLIYHEHVSVPVDLTTGKADLRSKPQ
jgi:ketosteroid isomerase-like protein